ncbi:hypothetical protein [Microvirga sp. TS319]|uniref:hypothetical protein n=1 Tax=Microvirga sp. TS319 TaxID=3241165 RepID=UPI00351A08D1
MYVVYFYKTGEKVIRTISDIGAIPTLAEPHKGALGCWNCGAPASWSFETQDKIDIECSDCGSQMIVAQGCVRTISQTPEGTLVARRSQIVPDHYQNCEVLPNGDLVLLPSSGDPDFHPATHDPIGCTPMELLRETAALRSKTRART